MNNPTEEQIRKCAYELYVRSGCKSGRDRKNWQEAERELKLMPDRDETPEPTVKPFKSSGNGDGKNALVASARTQEYRKGF